MDISLEEVSKHKLLSYYVEYYFADREKYKTEMLYIYDILCKHYKKKYDIFGEMYLSSKISRKIERYREKYMK